MSEAQRASSASFDLQRLRYPDAVSVAQSLRALRDGAATQEEVACRVVNYLFTTFCDPFTREPNCALVRCFQTHTFCALPEDARQAARRALVCAEPHPGLRCLTLLASRGLEPLWNDPRASVSHRAIPLPDVAMIERAPMIASLLHQLGLDARDIVRPGGRLLLESPWRSFNVFHVADAAGSEHIPAQQTFVERYGIRSVVGMGGLLPGVELFAVILFTRVPVPREVAELFRTLALSVKLAFLPFNPAQVFSPPASSERSA